MESTFTSIGNTIGGVATTIVGAITDLTETLGQILEDTAVNLFVPRKSMEERNQEIIDMLHVKMPFLVQVDEFAEILKTEYTDANAPPEIKINLPSKYGGSNVKVIDFSWALPFINVAWAFMVPFIWVVWFFKLSKRIPHWISNATDRTEMKK